MTWNIFKKLSLKFIKAFIINRFDGLGEADRTVVLPGVLQHAAVEPERAGAVLRDELDNELQRVDCDRAEGNRGEGGVVFVRKGIFRNCRSSSKSTTWTCNCPQCPTVSSSSFPAKCRWTRMHPSSSPKSSSSSPTTRAASTATTTSSNLSSENHYFILKFTLFYFQKVIKSWIFKNN